MLGIPGGLVYVRDMDALPSHNGAALPVLFSAVRVRPILADGRHLWDELMRRHHDLGFNRTAGRALRQVAEYRERCVAIPDCWPKLLLIPNASTVPVIAPPTGSVWGRSAAMPAMPGVIATTDSPRRYGFIPSFGGHGSDCASRCRRLTGERLCERSD
ncbi:MAG: hypothetical protein ACRERU_18510 [Methylococcales bacterium]